MPKKIAATTLLAALVFCLSTFPNQTQPQPSFSASSNLVVLDARVIHRTTGEPIQDLKKEDFEVRDRDNPETLVTAESGSFPLDIALELDTSGSVRQSTRQTATNAQAAINDLHRDDRVAVFSFSSRCTLQQPLTSDIQAAQEAIEKSVSSTTRAEYGTRLYDAIQAGLDVFPQPSDKLRRRAVIVVTDDRERSSKATAGAILSKAAANDATLNAVIVPTAEGSRKRSIGRLSLPIPDLSIPIPGVPPTVNRSPGTPEPNARSIEPLADETGGEYLRAADNADTNAVMQMLSHLRARYVLAYRLPPEQARTGQHRVTVTLRADARQRYPEAQIVTRKTYVY